MLRVERCILRFALYAGLQQTLWSSIYHPIRVDIVYCLKWHFQRLMTGICANLRVQCYHGNRLLLIAATPSGALVAMLN